LLELVAVPRRVMALVEIRSATDRAGRFMPR
jgi:deoxycytidine triphosphate deaminase